MAHTRTTDLDSTCTNEYALNQFLAAYFIPQIKKWASLFGILIHICAVPVYLSVAPWTTLEDDYIAFLLPAPKCSNCIKQVLMLELSKTNSLTGFSTGPHVRM
jgi:hypothetical protein